MIYTGYMIASARTLTGVGQRAFAKLADVNADTLNKIEGAGPAAISARAETIDKILACLAQHGVGLVANNIFFTLVDGERRRVRKPRPKKNPGTQPGGEPPKHAGANANRGVRPANDRQLYSQYLDRR